MLNVNQQVLIKRVKLTKLILADQLCSDFHALVGIELPEAFSDDPDD